MRGVFLGSFGGVLLLTAGLAPSQCEDEGRIQLVGTVTTNQCPRITEYSVSPLRFAVGGSAALRATADDPEGDPIVVRWTASSGEIVARGAAGAAEYRCTTVGTHKLTLVVTNLEPAPDAGTVADAAAVADARAVTDARADAAAIAATPDAGGCRQSVQVAVTCIASAAP